MNNIVNELNALKKYLDTEVALRAATQTEFNQGVMNGPMFVAHMESIQNVIAAAQQLVDASK